MPQIVLNLPKLYFLLHPRLQVHILHKIVFVGSIKHCGYIHLVLLLCNASADPHIAIHFGVHLERYLQYAITFNVLKIN